MIIRFALIVLAVLLSSYLITGITVSGLYTALVIAVLLAIANVTLKPLLTVLTLPIHFITLGLSSFLVSAFIFWLLSTFIDGFVVSGFVPALLGALLIAVVGSVGDQIT